MLNHLLLLLWGAVVFHPSYEKRTRCRALALFDQTDWLNAAGRAGWEWKP